MVEEQPSCITDTDELRILMESARSHGYFSPPPLENREYLIEEPIGVAVSDTSQPEYLTLRLDCHPEHHIIGRPGMKIMLVLADALRLIGLSTPKASTSNTSISTPTTGTSSIQTPMTTCI